MRCEEKNEKNYLVGVSTKTSLSSMATTVERAVRPRGGFAGEALRDGGVGAAFGSVVAAFFLFLFPAAPTSAIFA
jgi:TctA family transporter